LIKQPLFAKKIETLIRRKLPGASFALLSREAAWGAIELARTAIRKTKSPPISNAPKEEPNPYYVPEFSPAESPTEQRNPASMRFHEFTTPRMVNVMLDAEAETVPALRKERKSIVRAVELASETLQQQGRIFYIGAGTSGRLGILDASECPPTFRASPELVQGIIAGGQRAIWQAVEGAEDDAEAGAQAIASRSLTSKDLVIGIAASGRTPFVWGALAFAKKQGSKTVLICFNPSLQIDKAHRPHVLIAPNLGPEILTGSTRLKSGTATKIILNMISTIAMVRIGKVLGNLMVDLNPSNVKLRDRAIRILRELTGCTAQAAQNALERNAWVVKSAWEDLKR
jgi:N-acetylmuramic acid 6-phosphate etherase